MAAKDFGTQVRVCDTSAASQPVTGRFDFNSAADISGLLASRGLPVSFNGSVLEVGCDQASRELEAAGVVAPLGVIPGQQEAVPAIGPQSGVGAPSGSYGPPTPPPEAVYRQYEVRYRDPSKIVTALAKLPGLSVIADPAVPGPLLLVGPASVVVAAERYVRAVDVCPAQVQIEATVVSQSKTLSRSRGFGLQFNTGGANGVGTFDPLAQATISIPGLRVFLDGLRETGQFEQNSTLRGRVILGEQVKVQDGQDVPIRAATSVTDRETRQDVIYRQVGHRMTFKLLSLADNDAIVQVDHELSSQTGNGTLGPVFTARSMTTTMRVALGSPALVSLSGNDTASKVRSRGIFSRNDATEIAKGGAFLAFALERVGCVAGPGPQRSEDRKPAAEPAREGRKGKK